MRFPSILAGLGLAAAPLVSAGGVPIAYESNLTVSVTPTVGLTNADFIYIYNNNDGLGIQPGYQLLGTLPAVQTSTFHFNSAAIPTGILEYSVAAQYGGGLTGGGGVVVGLPAVQANAAVGKDWNTFFAVGPGTSTQNMFVESSIDNAIATQNATLLGLFNNYEGPADAIAYGTTGDLVSFTNGALAGNIKLAASAVPEPVSLSLIATTTFGLLSRRRRRTY
jgi:hypothetical protein